LHEVQVCAAELSPFEPAVTDEVLHRSDRRCPTRGYGPEPLLSPEQVAAWCGLSRRAVYRAIERGELRASRLCHRLRIRPADVETWMDATRVPARPAALPITVRDGARSGLRRLLEQEP